MPPPIIGNPERTTVRRTLAHQTDRSLAQGYTSALSGSGSPARGPVGRRAAGDFPIEDSFALPPLAAATPCGPPVAIYWVDKTGRVRFEGIACKGAATGRKLFEHWVTFVGESRPRRRLVLPEPYQSQVDAILRGLQALYEGAGASDIPDVFLTDVLRVSAANDNHASDEKEA